MKRHKSLIALSQDHHHGLLLSQLIKEGAPEYKGLPKDTDGKVKYAMNAWEHELSKHFKSEETVLFPFVKGNDNVLDCILKEILLEHEQIKILFKSLTSVENKDIILNDIGHALEAHIRKEERILFQRIQEIIPDEELNKLVGLIEPVKSNKKKSC